MAGIDLTRLDQGADKVAVFLFQPKVHRRRRALFAADHFFEENRGAKMAFGLPYEKNHITVALEIQARPPGRIL